MIVVIGGVSGTGKTTVGTLLASRLNWEFADGDAFHPAANIAKMRSGQALTDADRQPWLAAIGRWMDQRIAAGQPAVLACSLLKRGYRGLLLDSRPAARLVFLTASRELLHARLAARHGHFFSARLLGSQLADLELPAPAEDALVLSAAGPPARIVAEIISGLRLTATAAPGPPRARDNDR
ncbi:MAG TPA: gluconokinase [Streptosporangiaceae bacterium]|jgi:gluconokinase